MEPSRRVRGVQERLDKRTGGGKDSPPHAAHGDSGHSETAMIAACVLVASAALGAGQTPADEPRAFIEVRAAREVLWLHEPLPVTLRFGFEREFLERQVIQPFQRELDVPAQIHASWIAGLACAELTSAASAAEPTAAVTATFVLEDDITRAGRAPDELRAGQSFAVFEFERTLLPTCTGALELPAAHLRFAWATRFREDAFGERTPEDRRDEVVAGRSLVLEVRPLPEQGRPAGFTGAVGRFTIRAEADRSELLVGQSLKLLVSIEGEGDLGHFGPPRLERLEGLRQQGWVEELVPDARRITYDLAAVSDLARAIPAISWSFFDPGPPAGYRSLSTEPIPIRVRVRLAESPTGSASQVDSTAPDQGSDRHDDPVFPLWLGASAGAALLILIAALAVSRSRRGKGQGRALPPTDPARAWAAAEQFRARASAPGVDLAQALAEFLADRLGCPVPAVIAPDLRSRLTAAGISPEQALRVAHLLDGLVAARYGGPVPRDELGSISQAVEALDHAFQRARRAT